MAEPAAVDSDGSNNNGGNNETMTTTNPATPTTMTEAPLLSTSSSVCQVGTSSDSTNATVPTTAAACPRGCYLPYTNSSGNGGSDGCIPVGPGYYSPVDDDERYSCPSGTFSSSATAGGDESCTECPPGTYAPFRRGSAYCEYCPAGTYSDVPGTTSLQGCYPCSTAYYDGIGSDYGYYDDSDYDDNEDAGGGGASTTTTTTVSLPYCLEPYYPIVLPVEEGDGGEEEPTSSTPLAPSASSSSLSPTTTPTAIPTDVPDPSAAPSTASSPLPSLDSSATLSPTTGTYVSHSFSTPVPFP